MQDIMRRFESLGANCEFAFVLQRYGVEAGSLFRYALLPSLQVLIECLESDFAGMFLYENILPMHETMVVDMATGIGWHAPIQAEKIDPNRGRAKENFRFVTPPDERQALWASEQSKLDYLTAKLRASLAAAETIFVFKPFFRPYTGLMERDDMARLLAALRRFGPNRLLVVTKAVGAEMSGHVEDHGGGLMQGYVDRFAPGSQADDVSWEAWLEVCRKAHGIAFGSVALG
jgi:hypothetical protein